MTSRLVRALLLVSSYALSSRRYFPDATHLSVCIQGNKTVQRRLLPGIPRMRTSRLRSSTKFARIDGRWLAPFCAFPAANGRVRRRSGISGIYYTHSIRGRSYARRLSPVSVSHTRGAKTVRVLVTVEPRMYREAIALAVQRNRPKAEVMLVPEEVLDGQVKDFAPHVLVRNDFDRAIPEGLLGSVMCRMEVLYTDGMAARVSVGDSSHTIEDATMEDLLALVDEAEDLISG